MKKITCFLIIFMTAMCVSAKNHEDGWKWNVTIKDYSSPDTMGLLETVYGKVTAGDLDKLLSWGHNVIKNPLYSNNQKLVHGTTLLYAGCLSYWSDYIKFVFCGADGLQYFSQENLDMLNEIFPDLCTFAQHFFNGDYTNGVDPYKSDFVKDELWETIKNLKKSFDQMEPRVKNLDYFLSNPAEIPRLTFSKKTSGFSIFIIFILLIIISCISFIVIAFMFRGKNIMFEKTASFFENCKLKFLKRDKI